ARTEEDNARGWAKRSRGKRARRVPACRERTNGEGGPKRPPHPVGGALTGVGKAESLRSGPMLAKEIDSGHWTAATDLLQLDAPPIVPRVNALVLLVAVALIAWVIWDAFETILLPRRVPGRLRLSRLVTRGLWVVWAAFSALIGPPSRRENFLAY